MIEDKKVVTLSYMVKDSEGAVIDSTEGTEPLVYLHGASNIIPGLETALTGKAVDEEFDVSVEPKDAYGEYNETLVQVVPREAFEGVEAVEPGMAFSANTPNGPIQLIVTGVEGDDITVDPNHPLAGKTLSFSGKIMDVREATAEELEHGHVHTGGGCCSGHGDEDSECCKSGSDSDEGCCKDNPDSDHECGCNH